MNFTEFSFWWILFVVGIPCLAFRYVAKQLGLWMDVYDRFALSAVSLILFYNAASSSFNIFISELAFNYFAIRVIQHTAKSKSLIVALVIAIDLLILVHFKYIDFLVKNSFGLISPYYAEALRQNFSFFKKGSIPPGISFYTFQMIAFLVDTARKGDRQPISLLNYLNFASFFPQIVAGPIERRADLFPQMEKLHFSFSYENIEMGLRWLVLGMFMKVVLADNLSGFILRDETSNAYLIWLATYLFGLKIYFDFAGYSFISLGLARVLGIKLTLNFSAPYTSTNIQVFWRRWHITLTRWLLDYLYIPLGGSRVRWVYFNILVVFLLCGLWHGAGWNYVAWGGYHGLLLALFRYWNKSDFFPSLRSEGRHGVILKPICWATTFFFAMFGWLFFMETNASLLKEKLESISNPCYYTPAYVQGLIDRFSSVELGILGVTLVLSHTVLVLELVAVWKDHQNPYRWLLLPWVSRVMLAMIILIPARSPSMFIYFDF